MHRLGHGWGNTWLGKAPTPLIVVEQQLNGDSPLVRGYRGAGKIREKLGWQPSIGNPPGDKPKGMHWKTYNRLMKKHIDYSYDAYRGMMATFKKIDARFSDIARDLNI